MKNGGFIRRLPIFVGLILTCLYPAASIGQTPPDAKAILTKVADACKAMRSFRFDGICIMEFGTGSSAQKIEIPLLSAAVIPDNKMRFEAKNTFMGGLTAAKVDVPLPDELFVFTPPKGATEVQHLGFGPTPPGQNPPPSKKRPPIMG